MPKASTQSSTSAAAKKVPRPMNCFLAFRLEKQNEIVARCPGANHRDISKIIAKYWKETSEEEKEPYRRRAYLAKLEHEKLYPDYKYQPQKKNGRKTRKYERKVKDTFTSRNQGNNRMMELFYKNPRILDDPNVSESDATSPALEQQHQFHHHLSNFVTEKPCPAMGNASVAATTPSPLLSDANSPMTIGEPALVYYPNQDNTFVVDPFFIQQAAFNPVAPHIAEATDLTAAVGMPTTMDTASSSSSPFTYTYFDPLSYYGHPMGSCIDPQLLSCQQEIFDANMINYTAVKPIKEDSYYTYDSYYNSYYPQL